MTDLACRWFAALMLGLLLLAPLHAGAQTIAAPTPDTPVALFADQIDYDLPTQEIVASGSVEAYYQDNRLTADEIRYNGNTQTISARGNIRLETADGTVLLASLAELSTDFREGLIEGARLILDQQFQVASVEAARTQGRFTELYNTVGSSCIICAENPVPIWQIRARRVVHDQEKQRVYFEGAWLDIMGVPVAYVPRLRVPEPGVRRAEGVLVPTVSQSNVYGFGLKVPYYVPLGDHSDYTLTPFVTTSGASILEAEYRRRFAAGALTLTGIGALDDALDGTSRRGYLGALGAFDIGGGFNVDFDLQVASDRSFLGQFDYSSDDRLFSFASLNSTDADTNFDLRTEAYQSLRDDEKQGGIPFVLPQVNLRQIWTSAPNGAVAGVDAGALSLARTAGRDVLRGNLGADLNVNSIVGPGVEVTMLGSVDTELYQILDDPDTSDGLLARVTPTVGAELRFPLARHSADGTVQVIEPIVQALYSRRFGASNVPNEDSLLPELDETNLFSVNRFPGIDARESGFRLNSGVNYTRFDPNDWTLGATVGRVIKLDRETDFPESTGLSGEYSDFVTAVSVDNNAGISAIARGLFDAELGFNRAEIEIDYTTTRFDLAADYTFLPADGSSADLGAVTERQEVSLESRYRFAPNWEAQGKWRYDIADERAIFGQAGLAFGNECIEAGLVLSRRYTSSNNVPRATTVSLQVSLAGFGATGDRDWPSRRCQGT